jgi:hypothetical protein
VLVSSRHTIQALFLLAACAFGLRAQTAPFSFGHGAIALADFDGDGQLDYAVADPRGQGNLYRIDVHLGAGGGGAILIAARAKGGLHVAAVDVDGDHDIDLVITTEYAREPVGVWLNDGSGGFSEADASSFPYIWRDCRQSIEGASRQAQQPVVVLSTGVGLVHVEDGGRLAPAPRILPKPSGFSSNFSIARASTSLRAPPVA